MRHQNDVVKVVHYFFVKSVGLDQSNQDPTLNRSSLTGSSQINCVTDPIVESVQLGQRVPIGLVQPVEPNWVLQLWVFLCQVICQ